MARCSLAQDPGLGVRRIWILTPWFLFYFLIAKGQVYKFHLYTVSGIVTFIETRSKMVVSQDWGELVLKGYRASVLEDEKVLQMDGGGGCTTR